MLSHTSIRTSNMDKSIDFYTKYFGLKLLSRIEVKSTNSEIAFLQDPQGKGSKLELTSYRDQTVFKQADYMERLFEHLGFDVKDINATITLMRKDGVKITDEPYRFGKDGPLIAFVEDPNGTLVELVQR